MKLNDCMKNLFLFLAFWSTVPLLGQRPQLVVPIGHRTGISSVAFSPNGQLILTGADADLVYVDVYDYPNAYSLGGFYRQRADGIALKLRLLHGDETPVTLEIPVTEDPEKLVKLIVRAVKKEIP